MAMSPTLMRPKRSGPPNSAPVITVPGAQHIPGNTSANGVKSEGDLNSLVSITDDDGDSQTVTLAFDHGTISLPSATGLTFSVGDGNDDATMTFSGTLSNVAASLLLIRLKAEDDYVGAATLSISTNDGRGGTDSDTVSIVVDLPNISDSFTGSNGSSLSGWTNLIGTYNIQSNRAAPASTASPGGQAVTYRDYGGLPFSGSVVVNSGSKNFGGGFAFDINASTKAFYFVQIDFAGGTFDLYRFNGTGYTREATTAISTSTNTDYTIALTVNGTAFAATVDGGTPLSATLAVTPTETNVGIRADGTGARFDDFLTTHL